MCGDEQSAEGEDLSFKSTTQAWSHSGLKPLQRLVLLCLANHANEADECWPSLDTLAKETGISRRYVVELVHELASLGLVSMSKRKRSATTLYRLTQDESVSADTSDVDLDTLDGEPSTPPESPALVNPVHSSVPSSLPVNGEVVNPVHHRSEPSSPPQCTQFTSVVHPVHQGSEPSALKSVKESVKESVTEPVIRSRGPIQPPNPDDSSISAWLAIEAEAGGPTQLGVDRDFGQVQGLWLSSNKFQLWSANWRQLRKAKPAPTLADCALLGRWIAAGGNGDITPWQLLCKPGGAENIGEWIKRAVQGNGKPQSTKQQTANQPRGPAASQLPQSVIAKETTFRRRLRLLREGKSIEDDIVDEDEL